MSKLAVLNKQCDALGELFNLLNSYIASFAPPDVFGEWPLRECYEEEKRWRKENLENFDKQAKARIAVHRAGIEVPVSWQPPRGAIAICKVETTVYPERRKEDGGIIRDGWGKVVRPGVDSTWAAQAQREIMAKYEKIAARREALISGDAIEAAQELAVPVLSAAVSRNTASGGYKTTCAVEGNAKSLPTWKVARQRGESSVHNSVFPGLNKLASWCRCNAHTMRKAIANSEKLLRAEAASRLAKPAPAQRSPKEPTWELQVDEALDQLIECAPDNERARLNTPEMREQLAGMEPEALSALVDEAHEHPPPRVRCGGGRVRLLSRHPGRRHGPVAARPFIRRDGP